MKKLLFLLLIIFSCSESKYYQSFKISTFSDWNLYSPQQILKIVKSQSKDFNDLANRFVVNNSTLLYIIKGDFNNDSTTYLANISISEQSDPEYQELTTEDILKNIIRDMPTDNSFKIINANFSDTNSYGLVYSQATFKIPSLLKKLDNAIDTVIITTRIYQTDSLDSFYLINSNIILSQYKDTKAEIDSILDSFKLVKAKYE